MTAMAPQPLSALELREAVKQGVPVDAERLGRVLRVDPDRGLVEVQAGTRWQTLAESLRPGDEQAAATAIALPTVGQSLAWNAAGPDGRPAVTHVESLTLVVPEGELRRINRITHGDLFALIIGGQGLFGTLYSITLRIDSLARAVSEATAPEKMQLGATLGAGQELRLLVPPESLAAFLSRARAVCEEWRIALQSIAVRRTVPETDSFLRWARRPYADVGLSLGGLAALGGAVRATQAARALIDAAIAMEGSFPIACAPLATRSQVELCYPQLGEFLAEKRRMDPHERLTNAWYRHYRNLMSRTSCAVRFSNPSSDDPVLAPA
jgi:FAD/FMN-containing dehydrogenase